MRNTVGVPQGVSMSETVDSRRSPRNTPPGTLSGGLPLIYAGASGPGPYERRLSTASALAGLASVGVRTTDLEQAQLDSWIFDP